MSEYDENHKNDLEMERNIKAYLQKKIEYSAKHCRKEYSMRKNHESFLNEGNKVADDNTDINHINKIRKGDSTYVKDNFVFSTKTVTFYCGTNLLRLIYNFCEKAEIERINVHTLRHIFAIRMLEAGEAAKIVQEILGHEDITTTLNRYTHVLPDTKKKSVQKLNHIFALA